MAANLSSTTSREPIIPLGTVVKPWGKVAAVMLWEGERCYMFRGCGVTLMPAAVVESQYKRNRNGR